MTAQETGLDGAFRERVLDVMTTALANLLQRSDPISEEMRLMEELGMSSTLGLELMLELEERLQVLIDVERMGPDDTRTVGDMATFVAHHSQPA
jgi:acyl carrier protein